MIPFFTVVVDPPDKDHPDMVRSLRVQSRCGRMELLLLPHDTPEDVGDKIASALIELIEQEAIGV